jgi:hypothetical protein
MDEDVLPEHIDVNLAVLGRDDDRLAAQRLAVLPKLDRDLRLAVGAKIGPSRWTKPPPT